MFHSFFLSFCTSFHFFILGNTIAYYDTQPSPCPTIRHVNCDLIVEGHGIRVEHCLQCQEYRLSILKFTIENNSIQSLDRFVSFFYTLRKIHLYNFFIGKLLVHLFGVIVTQTLNKTTVRLSISATSQLLRKLTSCTK